MLGRHKRINDNRVGLESTENSQMLGSQMISKHSFLSNQTIALTSKNHQKKESSDTIVQLKSVALNNTGNSTAFRALKSGKDSESN